MTDRPTEQRTGDRGRWYFQVLGIESEAGPQTLQEMARIREATKTSELVTGMWDQTAEPTAVLDAKDPLADWSPAELSRRASSPTRVRWSLVLAAGIVVLAAVFALWWIPQASQQRADAHAELIRDSLTGLYSDLGGLQNALAVATEPASEAPDLGAIALGLSAISDSAARLLDVANEPVPNPLLLSSQQPFDDLDEFRLGLEPMAAEATALRTAVGEIAEYRLALSNVLATGELPLTADSSIITDQRAAMAAVLAESVAALNTMPTEGPFADHRVAVDSEISRFAQWQNDYLSALRAGEATSAGELVEQLAVARSALRVDLIATLAALRTDIDSRILTLADRLSQAIITVPD